MHEFEYLNAGLMLYPRFNRLFMMRQGSFASTRLRLSTGQPPPRKGAHREGLAVSIRDWLSTSRLGLSGGLCPVRRRIRFQARQSGRRAE